MSLVTPQAQLSLEELSPC